MEREMNKTRRPGYRLRAAVAWLSIAVATLTLGRPAITFAAPVVFDAAGSAPADIQAVVEEFRHFLGDNNGVGDTFSGGRREINWDAVPDGFAAPNNLPANFFNKNSPRGVVFFTPGSGFQVSAREGVAPTEFDNLRPDASRQVRRLQSPAAVHGAREPDHGDPLFRPRHGPSGDQQGVRQRLH